jgi:hypothetical protein
MKKFKKYIVLTAAAFSLGMFSSCEKLVEGYDVDPTRPLSAPINLMLKGTQTMNIHVHEGAMARLAGMWSGYFVGGDRQYAGFWQYQISAGDSDDSWNILYAGVVQQSRIIQEQAKKTNDFLALGIAQTMEAHAIGTAAALWGDVPMTEAANFDQFPNPKYDAQRTVYQNVQTLLSDAIKNFEAFAALPAAARAASLAPAGDIYFGGNVQNWTKAAYTLKARFFMHTKDYASAFTNAQKGISSGAGSLYAPHKTNPVFNQSYNVYYDFMTYQRTGYLIAHDPTTGNLAHAAALLDPTSSKYRGNSKTDESARFAYFYQEDLQGSGGLEPNILSSVDGWGVGADEVGFFAAESDFPLITFEENNLILAEAGARTQGFTTGLQYLNQHRAYLSSGGNIPSGWGTPTMTAYTATDFNTGGIENKDGLAPDRALLREILEERYISFTGQIEGFNDLRRTIKETDVAVKVAPTKGNSIPLRMLYSQAEINANKSAPQAIGLFVPTSVNQ